ncbi:hypothetical protein JCM10003_2777 [Bacteroides pyogenes JCM 10003]|nr:hypothetical protein JCM10003_2777 [Bacteroides pyogenes JCM 10003]
MYHVLYPVRRIRRVDRHICASCKKDPKLYDRQVEGSVQQQDDLGAPHDAQRTQEMRHLIGSLPIFRIGQGDISIRNRLPVRIGFHDAADLVIYRFNRVRMFRLIDLLQQSHIRKRKYVRTGTFFDLFSIRIIDQLTKHGRELFGKLPDKLYVKQLSDIIPVEAPFILPCVHDKIDISAGGTGLYLRCTDCQVFGGTADTFRKHVDGIAENNSAQGTLLESFLLRYPP